MKNGQEKSCPFSLPDSRKELWGRTPMPPYINKDTTPCLYHSSQCKLPAPYFPIDGTTNRLPMPCFSNSFAHQIRTYRSLTDDSKVTLAGSTSVFTDVSDDSWYHDAVSVFASVGVLNGCNGFFCPNDNLTYGQLTAILTRFVDAKTAPMPDVPYAAHWAYKNIVTAAAYGWIQDAASVQPDRIVTRGEVVLLVNQIFQSVR